MSPIIGTKEFETLVNHAEPGSISLFMPTHRAGFATQQNAIRFKNLLDEAEERLIESGWRRPDAEKRLRPLRPLLDDGRFWQNQLDGLAFFYGGGEPIIHRVPLLLPELVMTGERFYLKPLLPFLDQKLHFYILALAQKAVRLYLADRFQIREATPESIPQRMEVLAEAYETDRILQFHTKTPPAGSKGERAAIFHGQGVGTDEAVEKKRLVEFCQQINTGLVKVLRGQGNVPLVLAATEPLLGIYRQINSYAHMEEEVLHRHPERVNPEDLRRQAFPIVEAHYRKDRQAAANQYRRLVEARLATDDLDQVVAAAHKDQVATLFVSIEDQQWGRFDPESLQAETHGEPQPGDRDLLDLAAVRAYLSGSVIYPCQRHEMPSQGIIAAIYRFSATP